MSIHSKRSALTRHSMCYKKDYIKFVTRHNVRNLTLTPHTRIFTSSHSHHHTLTLTSSYCHILTLTSSHCHILTHILTSLNSSSLSYPHTLTPSHRLGIPHGAMTTNSQTLTNQLEQKHSHIEGFNYYTWDQAEVFGCRGLWIIEVQIIPVGLYCIPHQ